METGFGGIGAAVADCAARSPMFLSDDELIAALDTCQTAVAQLAALQLSLVREMDGRGLAKTQGASSTQAWLHGRFLLDPSTAHQMVRLASDLDSSAPQTRAAFTSGQINDEQAQVICQALAELPDELDAETRVRAEAQLVEFARSFNPRVLRRLGRRIIDTVDPELAARLEAELLAKQEERAYAARRFTMRPDLLTGGVRVSGWLDTEGAAIVNAALDPLCAPRRGRQGVVDERTPGQRRADALTDICRLALATGELPDSGGDRPQLAVLAGFDGVTGELTAGSLDTGQRLSPEAVRRLACDAQLLPGLLDGAGQVLDLGRERRTWTGPSRKAILLRDGGCAFPGCDRPPRWTDVHHVVHWQHGGVTDRDNGVALCAHHHRVIHQGQWCVEIASDGIPEFTPPSYVDRHRRPLRNTLHRRI